MGQNIFWSLKVKRDEIVEIDNRIVGDIVMRIAVVVLALLFYCDAYISTFRLDISIGKVFFIIVIISSLCYFLVENFKKIHKKIFLATGIGIIIAIIAAIINYKKTCVFFEKAIKPITESFNQLYGKYIGTINTPIRSIKINGAFLCVLTAAICLYAILFFVSAKCNEGFIVIVMLMSIPVIAAATVGIFPKTNICIGMIFSMMIFRINYQQWDSYVSLKEFISLLVLCLLIIMCSYAVKPHIQSYREKHAAECEKIKRSLSGINFEKMSEIFSGKFPFGKKTVENVEFNGNISNADRKKKNNSVILKITLTELPESTFYLKNYIGVKYTGDKWVELGYADISKSLKAFNMMSDRTTRNAIQNEIFRKISGGRSGLEKQKVIIEVMNQAKNKGYIPYFSEISYLDTVNIAENIEFGDGINSSSHQQYDYYSYSDVKELGSSSLDYESGIWSDYEQYVVNQVDIKQSEGLIKLQEFAAGLDNQNVDRVANQIDEYFGSNLQYTLTPGDVPDNENIVEYFLFENKKGFCVHFATAAALIYRECGYPSRYVEGFAVSPNEFKKNKDGTYTAQVTGNMAHAWCETFDKNLGWIVREHTLEDRDNPVYAGDLPSSNRQTETQTSSTNETSTEQTSAQEETTELQKNDRDREELTKKAAGRENKTDAQLSGKSKSKKRGKAWKIILVIFIFVLLFAAIYKIRIDMHNIKVLRMKKRGNEGAVFAYTATYNIGLFLKRKYRGESEAEIFSEMMNAYPKLSMNEWRWMYEKAVEAKFSEKQISREDVNRMLVLYRKFRKGILSDIKKRRDRFIFLMKGL